MNHFFHSLFCFFFPNASYHFAKATASPPTIQIALYNHITLSSGEKKGGLRKITPSILQKTPFLKKYRNLCLTPPLTGFYPPVKTNCSLCKI